MNVKKLTVMAMTAMALVACKNTDLYDEQALENNTKAEYAANRYEQGLGLQHEDALLRIQQHFGHHEGSSNDPRQRGRWIHTDRLV